MSNSVTSSIHLSSHPLVIPPWHILISLLWALLCSCLKWTWKILEVSKLLVKWTWLYNKRNPSIFNFSNVDENIQKIWNHVVRIKFIKNMLFQDFSWSFKYLLKSIGYRLPSHNKNYLDFHACTINLYQQTPRI